MGNVTDTTAQQEAQIGTEPTGGQGAPGAAGSEQQRAEEMMERMSEAAAVEIVTKMMNQRPGFRGKIKEKIALIEEGDDQDVMEQLCERLNFLEGDERDQLLAGVDPATPAVRPEPELETTAHDEGGQSERRLRLDKASGQLRKVVTWVLKADYRTKVAVILSHNLLEHESGFKSHGLYGGDIGNDHLKDWEAEIAERHIEGDGKRTEEDIWIEGFTCALMGADA